MQEQLPSGLSNQFCFNPAHPVHLTCMDDVQGCTSVTVDMESIVTALMPRVQGRTGRLQGRRW